MLRRALVALLPFTLVSNTKAQGQTAQAFLEEIYKPYLQQGFPGQPYQEAERFFEPILAQAMILDVKEAKRRGQPPVLKGDPFVDPQNWLITGLEISVIPKGNAATGLVLVVNQKKPRNINIDLLQTPAGWRIAEIRGASGTLRGLYRLR